MGFVLLMLYGCALNPATSQKKKTIYTVKQKDETLAQAVVRVENELLFREHATLADRQRGLALVTDTIPVIGDTFRWKKRERWIKRDSKLKNFSKEELLQLLVIYDHSGGKDDRKDWYDADAVSQAVSNQTVCFILRDNLREQPDGSYELITKPFRAAEILCSAERFVDQPVAGFCSGFAVSRNLIVSAGHCLEGVPLTAFVMVFDFYMTDGKTARTRYLATEVYTPIQRIAFADDNAGKDFVVLKVDRAIPKERIATVRTDAVKQGEAVTVIGYPCGIPAKVVKGATAINISNRDFF